MGSLPNLHELGRDLTADSTVYRPGPALGRLCGGPSPALSQEEKSRILHRYSGHGRLTKARSNGNDSKIVYDDFMLEHMAAYSPVSSRSMRNLATNQIRRRDSLSSSIGTTSVRRLLAVIRPSGHHLAPRQTTATTPARRLLLVNLLILCLSHLLITAAHLPFVVLQSSVSSWIPPQSATYINAGSHFTALAYLIGGGAALLGPSAVRKLGANAALSVGHVLLTSFYLAHILPSLYVMVPAAIFLGLALGLLAAGQMAFLMTLALKVGGVGEDEDDDSKARRLCIVVRRMARGFRAAYDFGVILGSVITALVVTYTVVGVGDWESGRNTTRSNGSDCAFVNCSSYASYYDYPAHLDELFDTFEDSRLCGSQACPPTPLQHFNESTEADNYRILPKYTADILAAIYASLCLTAALFTLLGLDRIRMYVYQDPLERSEGLAALRAVRDSFKDVRLRMAAPMAFFVGLEQAFIYADFGKSYVVCTLGVHRLNLVFLSMGLLQSIAACTLSMLLRSIRRYYVVAVGFTFHACLLMVLIVWKPIEDDPALFYVISAAWGVCNAIWEMLNFTLLTGLYAEDNIESSMANATFFRFLGLSTAFAFHGLLCNYCKLYALGFCLVVAVVPFAWLEIRLENMRKVKHITRL